MNNLQFRILTECFSIPVSCNHYLEKNGKSQIPGGRFTIHYISHTDFQTMVQIINPHYTLFKKYYPHNLQHIFLRFISNIKETISYLIQLMLMAEMKGRKRSPKLIRLPDDNTKLIFIKISNLKLHENRTMNNCT